MLDKIINKINQWLNVKSLLENKKFAVTFSVVLAFLLWLIIMINQNPIREQTFNDISATVSLENSVASELGLGIVSDISQQKFSVKLSGPNYIVSSLKPEDFILNADISEVNTSGKYKLKIVGARNSSKTGYTFKSIYPSEIEVTFDFFDTKEYPLTAKVVGAVAKEGLIAEAPIINGFEKGTITVKGPRSIMDKINSVVAYTEVNKTLETTQTYTADIKIFDKDQNPIDMTNIVLESDTVKLSVPISKKATLPVKAVFNNLPAGFTTETMAYKLDHNTVTVIGPPDVIDKMKAVELSPIDMTAVSKTSNKFEVSPVLQDGVKLLDNIKVFIVTIETKNYSEKTLAVRDIRYKGLSATDSATSDKTIRNVKICGPKADISKITSADLYAEVDLSNCTKGQYTVDVIVKSQKYPKVWQVGTYSLAVTIK